MTKNIHFDRALQAGHLQVALLPDNSEFIRESKTGEPITYYWATENGVNLYAGRFHALMDVLRGHDQLKLSGDVLDSHLTTLSDLANSAMLLVATDPAKSIAAMSDCRAIIERLKIRRGLGMEMEQLYDVAGAWFFTEDENPFTLDLQHSAKKKAHFLMYPELHDFFLAMRINRFLPFSTLLDLPTQTLSVEQTAEELFLFKRLLLTHGESGLSPATISTIRSRQETLLGFVNLGSTLSKPTSTT